MSDPSQQQTREPKVWMLRVRDIRVVEAEPVAELLEELDEFLPRVETFNTSDPEEIHEVRRSIQALLSLLKKEP